MRQKTIAGRIHCTGTGLHSGRQVHLALRPATEDTGILFHVKTPQGVTTISPAPDLVMANGLATTLCKNGACVSTVEHLLGALRGLGVDNIHIDVDGGEIPIMDGSAAPFVALLSETGLHEQKKARKVLRIRRPVSFAQGDKYITAEPDSGFCVDYSIDFPHPAIGVQRMQLAVTPRTFRQIAEARTFGFLRDVEMLQSRGLAVGGSLKNAIVLDEHGVMNTEGLRFTDEFVRHKLLDFIGDMAILPLPLQGRFTVHCSGHALNNAFLRLLLQSPSQYLNAITLEDERSSKAAAALRHPARSLPAPAYAAS